MDFVRSLIRDFFPDSDQQLRFGGAAVGDLASEFETPLFIYDLRVITRRLDELQTTFGDDFQIYYSIKANPNPSLLKYFTSEGCGLEVASAGELHQALQAGCAGENILFAGPGKTDAELKLAIDANIGEVHVESLNEAKRLSKFAQQRGRTMSVGVRVNPQEAVQSGAMTMGGRPTQFGIDEEQLPNVVPEMTRCEGIHVCGLHLYPGTQILSSDVLLKHFRHTARLAGQVAEMIGKPLKTIDFGGGIGGPYFPSEQEMSLTELQAGLPEIVSLLRNHSLLKGAQLVIEPGRFLVASAGVYVCRVIDIKVSRGQAFVIVDGGMHHHLAASGNFGQNTIDNFPIAVVNRLQKANRQQVEIVGPLCLPLDHIGRGIDIPEVEVGDLIGVFCSGAYAMTASPLGFLSHPTPAEVLVDNGSTRLIRPRGIASEFAAESS